jgi:hypothetical protein
MREEKPEVRNTLIETKQLEPQTEEKLKAALEEFRHRWDASHAKAEAK